MIIAFVFLFHLRLTFLQNSAFCKNLSSWLICLLRVSVTIHNHKAPAWPKLLSKNKTRNTLFKRRGKINIVNVLEQDLNHRLMEAVCPSFITNFFLPRLMFEEILFLFSLCALSQCSCQTIYSLPTDADCVYEFVL